MHDQAYTAILQHKAVRKGVGSAKSNLQKYKTNGSKIKNL